MDRGRREHAAIAAPAADDDVGAFLQQVDEWMHAGHRNDPFGSVELSFGQRTMCIESFYGRAVAHSLAQALLVDLRIEVADVEARDPMACRKLLDDLHVEIDAA